MEIVPSCSCIEISSAGGELGSCNRTRRLFILRTHQQVFSLMSGGAQAANSAWIALISFYHLEFGKKSNQAGAGVH